MSGSKKIAKWILFLMVPLLGACQAYKVPVAYNTRVGEIKKNPYGCWSQFIVNADTLSGELICVDNDTVYLLVDDYNIKPLLLSNINDFRIYTHKNQTGTFGAVTLLYAAPSLIGAAAYMADYAGDFLLIGAPVAAIGITAMIIESSKKKNQIRKENFYWLDNIKLYARFPAGKPVGVDLGELTLKK